MNKLMYVEKNDDQVIVLRDDEMNLDNVLRVVQVLFDRGVKFVGLETDVIKLYFDSNRNVGNKGITGSYKY